MLSAQKAGEELLLVSSSSDIHGSVLSDAFVQKNCSLHVRGNLRGNLTIERGAHVVIEGSIDGKVINRGGRLVVNNRGIAEFIKEEGPPEAEAGGILKINLTAVAFNWETLAKRVAGECAAVVKGDAFGCGIDPISSTLTEAGCRTFFVSNLAEAKRVRAIAPNATIYVLDGLYAGTGPVFASINARPVINSLIEMAEWDVFVASSHWQGGFAVNVDTGLSRQGMSPQEAAAIAGRVSSPVHGITLLMSHLDHPGRPDHPLIDRQISTFQDLRRLYSGVPSSLVGSSGIFLGPKAHFDVVRPGAALYGANPTPAVRNPMIPVIDLRARIVQVRKLAQGEAIADMNGWSARRPTRLAIVAMGYADGYPFPAAEQAPQAIVGGECCRVVGRPAMDLLAVDVTDHTDPSAVRHGEMVTIIGGALGIDDLAAAARSSAGEVLSGLGRRFHRVYHAN